MDNSKFFKTMIVMILIGSFLMAWINPYSRTSIYYFLGSFTGNVVFFGLIVWIGWFLFMRKPSKRKA